MEQTNARVVKPLPARPFRCLTRTDLKNLPEPEWIIEGYIPARGLATLYGPPGAGKSFLAIDWALSICTGEDWLGHKTVAGPVAYVACEGLGGINQRMAAWEKHHKMEEGHASGVFVFPDFGSLQRPSSTDELITSIRTNLPEDNWPAVIVVDTLSRALPGADENDAGQMNVALSQADRLRAEFDATVLFLHHTTKGTDTERGSTVLRGSCDTMLLLKDDDEVRTLEVTKQRDAAEGPPIKLFLMPVGGSAVVQTDDTRSASTPSTYELKLLETLRELYDGTAISLSRWELASGITQPGTFDRRKSRLIALGLVEKDTIGRGGYIPKEANGARRNRGESRDSRHGEPSPALHDGEDRGH